MKSFFDTISQYTTLTKEGEDALSAILRRSEVGKGQVLVKENSVCNYIYFIEKGLTRTYYYKEGRDVTDWISTEGTFACSILSFITRQPDRRGIETLEDSILYSLQYYELEHLFMKYHDVERLGRHIANLGMVQLQMRFDALHFETALERYKKLMEETPTLIQRVPLGMLASYLGVTQETLSRIRNKIQ
jgi:signal-transduction protein with cAMP-binding, CBS, and nucleotidyltransferase domain